MIYEPIPLKCCSKCRGYFPASLEYFSFHRATRSRLTSHCKRCACTYSKNYRNAHLEKAREKDRQWSKNNPQKKSVKAKRHYARHREKIKEKNRRYYSENPDKIKRANKKWAEANPEKRREIGRRWQKSHPEHSRGVAERRIARKRNLPATFTAENWRQCLEYFDHRCVYCGRPQGLWHTLAQDHFVPVTKGGGYTPDNIIPACHGDGGCNNSKSGKSAEEWLVQKFGTQQATRILKRVRDYFKWVKE